MWDRCGLRATLLDGRVCPVLRVAVSRRVNPSMFCGLVVGRAVSGLLAELWGVGGACGLTGFCGVLTLVGAWSNCPVLVS